MSVVQSNTLGFTGGSGTIDLAFNSDNAKSNAILLSIGVSATGFSAEGQIAGITVEDDLGNQYALLGNSTDIVFAGFYSCVGVIAAFSIAAGANVLHITLPIGIAEYSFIVEECDNAASLDHLLAAERVGSPGIFTGNVQTSAASEYLHSTYYNASNDGQALGVSNSFEIATNFDDTDEAVQIATADRVGGAAGTYGTTWSDNSPAGTYTVQAVVISFKNGASSGGPSLLLSSTMGIFGAIMAGGR